MVQRARGDVHDRVADDAPLGGRHPPTAGHRRLSREEAAAVDGPPVGRPGGGDGNGVAVGVGAAGGEGLGVASPDVGRIRRDGDGGQGGCLNCERGRVHLPAVGSGHRPGGGGGGGDHVTHEAAPAGRGNGEGGLRRHVAPAVVVGVEGLGGVGGRLPGRDRGATRGDDDVVEGARLNGDEGGAGHAPAGDGDGAGGAGIGEGDHPGPHAQREGAVRQRRGGDQAVAGGEGGRAAEGEHRLIAGILGGDHRAEAQAGCGRGRHGDGEVIQRPAGGGDRPRGVGDRGRSLGLHAPQARRRRLEGRRRPHGGRHGADPPVDRPGDSLAGDQVVVGVVSGGVEGPALPHQQRLVARLPASALGDHKGGDRAGHDDEGRGGDQGGGLLGRGGDDGGGGGDGLERGGDPNQGGDGTVDTGGERPGRDLVACGHRAAEAHSVEG